MFQKQHIDQFKKYLVDETDTLKNKSKELNDDEVCSFLTVELTGCLVLKLNFFINCFKVDSSDKLIKYTNFLNKLKTVKKSIESLEEAYNELNNIINTTTFAPGLFNTFSVNTGRGK